MSLRASLRASLTNFLGDGIHIGWIRYFFPITLLLLEVLRSPKMISRLFLRASSRIFLIEIKNFYRDDKKT